MTGDRAAALITRLRRAGLDLPAAETVAAKVLSDPDGGPGGWVGPVDLAVGVVLWVTLPVAQVAS